MKYLSTERTRKILVFIGALFLVGLGLYIFLQERDRKQIESEELVVTEPAPHDILFLSKDGAEYTNEGNINVRLNGTDYIVLPDGSVWEQNNDGSLKHVESPALINAVLTRALSVSDPLYTDSDAITRNIGLSDLSDEDIRTIAGTLGISESELRKIVQGVKQSGKNGEDADKSLFDVLGELDLRTLNDEEIKELAERLGVPEDELRSEIEKAKKEGRSLSANDALNRLTDSTMRKWIESGLVFEPLDGVSADDVIKTMSQKGLSPEDAFGIVAKEGFNGLFKALGLKEDDSEDLGKTNESENEQLLTGNENSVYNTDFLNTDGKGGFTDLSADLELLNALNGLSGANGSGGSSGVDGSIGLNGGGYDSTGGFGSAGGQGQRYASQGSGGTLADLNTQARANTLSYRAQNAQDEKKSFLTSFQNGNKVSRVEEESMKNIITAGTPIKAILYTGINTDLPGMITAIVSENVYDSFTKTNVLIPKFSRLIATYDSSVSWGQSRIMVAWTELIRPDGVIVNLNGFQGVDSTGHAGLEGDVNRHITSMIAASAMASLVSVSTGQFANASENIYLSALFGGGASGINNAASNLLNNAINRQNTITVEPGTKIVIMVNSNIELTTYKE